MARSKRKNLKKSEGAESTSAKRSRNAASHGFSTSAKDVDRSVFGTVVKEAGLYLKSGDDPDELGVEQAIFLKKLVALLKNHVNYPEVIEEFVEGLQQHIEEPNRFRLSLLPISVSEDFEGRCGGQDSLIRMFLGIEILQQNITNMLLEKLPEFMDEEDSHSTSNIPHLIMNQFRWLDRIVNSKDMTQKMMEMVSITSLDVQREIITCIPEVVDDSEHMGIARELRELLLQNTRLTVPILDALSNLNLRAEILSEVRISVLQMLPSAAVDDLPVVVKFILQSVCDADAFEVISELRVNLDLNSIIPPAAPSTPAAQRRPHGSSSLSSDKDGELLTLDAICSGIRFQKSVAEGWIKAIESVNTASNHKVIDLFVLLIIHSTANRKKAIESLIRNKIKSGHFTEEMLSTAFNSHSQILREYFSPLTCLAEVLLRSPEPTVCAYACALYRLAFISFDPYCRQEIVGSLVTHIGSGYQAEADSSLDVLCSLATSHADIVAPFAIFIKGVLDYLDNLKIRQIRKLFSILSILAFRNPQEGGMIQDDMHMVIRKQLSSDSKKYKRIGIIGAIMVVKNMARKSNSDNDSDETVDTASQRQSTLSNDVYKEVINMLDMVRASISGCPVAAALFFDELAWVIEQGLVDPKVEAWISETVVSDFQDDFLVDREGPLPSESLPVEFVYGLDEVEEGSIAVNILPLLLAIKSGASVDKEGDNAVPASLECLAPHFRLLRVCEQSQHKGDLEGIDALLGCPLVSFKTDIPQQFSTLAQHDKDVVCTALFHCVNWFREVVNAFSTQNDVDMRGKTISRLESITTLQKTLEDCLQGYPSFSPPLATFDFEDTPPQTVQPVGGVKRGRKGVKKSSKNDDSIEKEKDIEKENDNETMLENTTIVKEKGKEREKAVTVSINQYRPFLRELDLSVFTMLKCGLVSRSVLDSDMNTKETTILQIQPPQLQFLMEDLSRKLEHSLSSSTSTRRSFLKVKADKLVGFSNLDGHPPKDVAKFFVELLPVLCDHLEAASAFFQALVVRNDGILDGPGRDTEEAQSMASCFSLLFNCFQTFFSWSGFLLSGNRDLLKAAFTTLSSRTKLSSRTQPGFQELVKQGFQYLEQFSTTILDLSTAVALTKLLVAVNERGDGRMNTSIAELSGKFLKQEWIRSDGEKEHGTKFNENIQHLLRLHLSFSEDVLETLEEISTGAIAELIEEKQDGLSYPTLTKSTLHSYYKAMMEELVAHLKKSQSSPLKGTDSDEVLRGRLSSLNISVRIFHILINLVKAFEVRPVLGSALKYGRLFVETFMKVGMPLLDQLLRIHKDDVHGLLKNLQQSTRCLHHICGHSKVAKDISLTNHVPAMKKCLETFVFRVKAMLALNKCHEAFWLGNLKNRDIKGQEILSQVSTRENEDEEEDDKSVNEAMEVDEEDDEDQVEGSVASHETGGGEDDDDDEEEDKQSMSESF